MSGTMQLQEQGLEILHHGYCSYDSSTAGVQSPFPTPDFFIRVRDLRLMALQLKVMVQSVSPIKDMVMESPISIARHCLSPQPGTSWK